MEQLHFLHPLWLLALIPLALLWWISSRSKIASSKAWEKVIDARLLPLLLNGSSDNHNRSASLAKWLLAVAWIFATIALADPVWEKIPRPVFQTNSARVIVLDLSNSMQIDDLKPSRLARARFKIEDILSNSLDKASNKNSAYNPEGQIGLVLFAGDAFTASPLTRDSETIRALLQVLAPDIMPSQGSRVDLGLKKAHELLSQAGVQNGQILLIADGVSEQEEALKAVEELRSDGHRVSVLGVGTEVGGALPNIKYQNGESITVALDADFLQEIAKNGGGNYHLISTNNSDLKSVLTSALNNDNINDEQNKDVQSEDWKSTGPLIVLILLPLAALAFRRGWLFNILIATSLLGLIQPQPVYASSFTDPIVNRWNNLWSNKEQQAETALNQKQYDQANKLSKNPLMKGSANYKQEKYSEALEEFIQADGADARYNEANSLAKLERYEDAIEAYDKALELQPNMEDAKQNKAAIEEFLKKKKEQEKQSGENNDQPKDQQDRKKESQNGQNNDQQNNTKSENQEGKQEGKKGEEDQQGKNSEQQNGNDSKNQFSDANKNLDKKKENKADEKSDTESDVNDANISDKKDQPSDGNNNDETKGEEKGKEDTNEENREAQGTNAEAEELTEEEKMAAEQWLRRIPDDPGGLLRRKFKYQYKQRNSSPENTKQPW